MLFIHFCLLPAQSVTSVKFSNIRGIKSTLWLILERGQKLNRFIYNFLIISSKYAIETDGLGPHNFESGAM